MKTAEQAFRKWRASTAEAAAAWEAGVMRVRENPAAKAAARQNEWAAGCARAARTNKFARSLQQVTLEAWKRACQEKGAANYNNGVTSEQAQQKYQRFITEWMTFIRTGVDALPPRGTFQDNLRRATQMIQHLSQFNQQASVGGGGLFGVGISTN